MEANLANDVFFGSVSTLTISPISSRFSIGISVGGISGSFANTAIISSVLGSDCTVPNRVDVPMPPSVPHIFMIFGRASMSRASILSRLIAASRPNCIEEPDSSDAILLSSSVETRELLMLGITESSFRLCRSLSRLPIAVDVGAVASKRSGGCKSSLVASFTSKWLCCCSRVDEARVLPFTAPTSMSSINSATIRLSSSSFSL
mmetsp:Transcript_3338/g.7662  ORF Transcript_3338/g.7662 Transcript_3338/m.7662 type:complete len:204 (+) Transcript_3338:795-1406(+)